MSKERRKKGNWEKTGKWKKKTVKKKKKEDEEENEEENKKLLRRKGKGIRKREK